MITARAAAAGMCLTALTAAAQPESARYSVRFDSPWSPQTHAGAYPFDAHYSPPVGAVHSNRVAFWEPGGTASFGMELMAELGSTGPLQGEMTNAINRGDALVTFRGSRLDSPGSHDPIEFEASLDHDRLTLVTMVAPSPDWFVGTHGLPLRDADGDWIQSITVGLDVYDAGTDSGPEFTSGNADVTPHLPIANISQDPPFAGLPQLGSFTITLIDVSGCPGDVNDDGQVTDSDFFAWVTAFVADPRSPEEEAACDVNRDGGCSDSDFFAWVTAFVDGC